MSVTHVFGIRHHGPGCARALREALDALGPDIVLVEGPPDAHEVLPLLTHAAMRPPVALLIYAPEAPQRAVFYPFTVFSPEWQALSFALTQGVPARFIDLPQTSSSPWRAQTEEPAETPRDEERAELRRRSRCRAAPGAEQSARRARRPDWRAGGSGGLHGSRTAGGSIRSSSGRTRPNSSAASWRR